jgi:polyphosphate kinase
MEVGNKEQQRRFEARIKEPLQWKLSQGTWSRYKFSRARDQMLEATDSKHAPWYIVRSDDKKKARLNCITHLLSMILYGKFREKSEIAKA